MFFRKLCVMFYLFVASSSRLALQRCSLLSATSRTVRRPGAWISQRVLIPILACVFAFVAGCAGEDEPYVTAPTVALSKGNSECLSDLDSTVGLFIEGSLSPEKIQSFYSCLDTVVVTFIENTKGRGTGDNYTPNQIFRFLKQFFFGNLDLPKGMQDQIMQLKRILLGGDVDVISKAEISEARGLLKTLEQITLRMNPHMPHLNVAFKDGIFSGRKLESDRFQAASDDFEWAMQRFAGLLSQQNQEFSESQLRTMLIELHSFLNGLGVQVEPWTKYLPVFWNLKNVLVGPYINANGENAFSGKQWDELFLFLSKGVVTGVRSWFYFFNTPIFGDAETLFHLGEAKNDLEIILHSALSAHPRSEIPLEALDKLVDSLDVHLNFPIGLTADGLKHLIQLLVREGLTPLEERPSEGQRPIMALGRSQLRNLAVEAGVWLADQRAAWSYLSSGDKEAFGRTELGRAALGSRLTYKLDSFGRAQFQWGEEAPSYDLNSLSALNWKKVVIRMILRTFAEDSSRRDQMSSLTIDELISAQDQLWPVGEGLDLWERGDNSLALRVADEANLFMPRAEGDDDISYEEGIDYFVFVMSGLAAKDTLREDVLKHCDLIFIDEATTGFMSECFKRASAKYYLSWLEHTPKLQEFLANDPSGVLWSDFLAALEQTAVPKNEEGEITIYTQGDVMIMWVLIQYIETFYARFDNVGPENRINIPDATEAYQIFRGYLKKLLEGFFPKDKGRWAVFTYMLKYGKVPLVGDGIGGGVRFVWWKLRESSWKISADRLRLVKILAALNQAQGGFIFYPDVGHSQPQFN